MELRELVRGDVPEELLDRVVSALAERYGLASPTVRRLDADNWLSTPLVLDETYFVKVITRQNSVVHALFTTGRNIGAVTSGAEGFFAHFGTPYEMAAHELEATRRTREVGLNAPAPVEALEVDGLGVLVLEYLPAFDTLDELDAESERSLATPLFAALARLHANGLAHGDLRAENVLVRDGDLYFIDATNVDEAGRDAARAYDLACALAALEPLIGAGSAVAAAARSYDVDALRAAEAFLDFVALRPDHAFDAAALKAEIADRTIADAGAGAGDPDREAREASAGVVPDASDLPDVGVPTVESVSLPEVSRVRELLPGGASGGEGSEGGSGAGAGGGAEPGTRPERGSGSEADSSGPGGRRGGGDRTES
jgi:tRNA A-37 threonylcarbamoyl transferase component Bud32